VVGRHGAWRDTDTPWTPTDPELGWPVSGVSGGTSSRSKTGRPMRP